MQKDKNNLTIEAYNKGADHYAKYFNGYGVRKDDIDRAFKINISGSSKVLELGCANGRDAEYIVSEVGKENYIGIDASKELVKLAVDKLPEVQFHVKDINELDFDSETFGIIFSFHTVLHVNRENLEILLRKCYKYLKIGGILYVSSKYGDYKEIEIENLGHKKYYYAYKPEDLEVNHETSWQTVYKVIHDSEYGPAFTIALRKVK